MIFYSYADFEHDLQLLIPKCREFDPDIIIAVSRGGLIATQFIAYALDSRNVALMRSKLYDGTKKLQSVELESSVDIRGAKRVLIVEDIVDSGETLNAILSFLKGQDSDVQIKTVAPWYKKSAIVQPDFTCREADEWVEFFWEKLDG